MFQQRKSLPPPEGGETVHERLRVVCRSRPDAVAVVDGRRRVSYADLCCFADAAADRLAGEAALRTGDRVLVSLPNGVEFIACFLALARLGAVMVPIRPDLRAPERLHYARIVQPQCAIISLQVESGWRGIAEAAPFPRVIFAESLVPGASSPPPSPANCPPPDPSADVLYLSTSGTTGRPKLVPRSHNRLLAGVRNVGAALTVAASDRFLAVVPFHHANGFSNCMLLPLMHGGTIVSLARFRPREMARVVRQEAVSILIGSPLIYAMLVEQRAGPDPFRTVRIALSSGAPMPAGLPGRCSAELGLRVRQLYGSTETGAIAVETVDATPASGAAGVPLPGVDMRIVDERGRDVPPGAVGQVLVRSEAMMPGYVEQRDNDPDRFFEGYLRTGDLGRVDVGRRLWLAGRSKAVLNIAGIQVDPVEIEHVLTSMPEVKAARVVPALDRHGLEIIEAEVQPEDGAKPVRSEIVAFCRTRLAEYKIPRIIRIVDRVRQHGAGKDERLLGR